MPIPIATLSPEDASALQGFLQQIPGAERWDLRLVNVGDQARGLEMVQGVAFTSFTKVTLRACCELSFESI